MYCIYCGKEIPEGGVCDCPKSTKQRNKGQRRVLRDLAEIYRNWWKSPLEAKVKAEEKRPFAACGILVGVMFLMTLVYELFFLLGVGFTTGRMLGGALKTEFFFGRVLLLTLVTFLLNAVVYFAGKLVARLMTKQPLDGAFFANCFVGYAADLLPVPAVLFIGGLLAMAWLPLGILFGVAVFLYELLVLSAEFHNGDIFIATSKTETMIVYGIAVVLVFFAAYADTALTLWATGISDMVAEIEGVFSMFM